MLSIDDPDGRRTARMAFLYALALVPVSLLPSVYGLTGRAYFAGALALGVIYTAAGAAMWWRDAHRLLWARRVFFTSIIYLPLLLTLGVLDKVAR
jgi:protoheme IX farnesyltransferase